MPVVVHKPSTPLVTLEEVEGWRDELRILKQQRDAADRKIMTLEQKLAAADFFVRERAAAQVINSAVAPAPIPIPKSELFPIISDVVLPPATMHEAALTVLRRSPNGMEPKDIALAIRNDPAISDRIKSSHPNYIYTVLMRLTQRNEIIKDGTRYKLAERKSAGS
jgi:hypothetical protein